MLTLITGTPGAGKSLYAVWNFAKPVPGSTIESGQDKVPRKLYSNIKDLLVEHTKIGPEEINTWHTWAKPGDVILFDEVQEVWRPRSFGSKVPECIAALETHRHMGVDIILVTQHPMLVDPNIRRLVNQHLHLRRITKTVAMVYEWDHCENPGNTRGCVASKVWMHPKAAYALYKSAQLHTKPTARVPFIAWVGLLCVAGLAYAGPVAYNRLTTSLGQKSEVTQAAKPATIVAPDGSSVTTSTVTYSPPLPALAAAPAEAPPVAYAGCINVRGRCGCFSADGVKVEVSQDVCMAHTNNGIEKPVTFQDDPVPRPPSESELDAVRFSFLAKTTGAP